MALAWPSSARASDLSWSGPADCARSEQLVFQIERALGAPLLETGQVHLQVHVARTSPTAQAMLRIADDAAQPSISERRLVAPDCDKLVDTLAVAIALAIEAAVPPHETPAAAAPSPPAPEPAPPPTPEPAPIVATASAQNAALDQAASNEEASGGPIARVTA
ncbi:MAG TPA: hypothetical protein VMG12_28185, partial [Polyangiaceae bacterium]|nr:hypothetical protein [Polyangiaceae bacterium]